MGCKSAIRYVLDGDGKLVDAVIQYETASDTAPTSVEKEIARIVKEHRELKTEIDLMKKAFPENKCLIFDGGLDIEVVSKENS